MGIEFELKFQATEDALARMRQEIAGQEQQLQMQTTYYDTPGGKLSARHCTLRRRMENDVSVCTLKAPAAGAGRQEWEVVCDTIEEAVKKLCKLGGQEEILSLAKEGLQPICGARFRRIAKTICLEDTVVELALDSGVLMGSGREAPLCEMEVELKSGSEAVCTAFAQHLAARYGLSPEPRSKFRRALALYRGE